MKTPNALQALIDDGVIELDGKPLPAEGKELARLRSDVGMVFQSFNLFAHRSILENVTLGPIKVKGMKRPDAEKLASKIVKGEFTLEDMAAQFRQLRKMGDLKGLLGLLPGVGKIKKQLDDAKIDDRMIARQEAIILSMTPAERRNPKILNASRRRRIAAGSGATVQDVNRLLKQHQQMAAMMKKVGKLGKRGLLGGGGLPPGMLPPGMPPLR